MILLQSQSKYLLQVLTTRLQNLDKGVELDCQWIEFDEVGFNVQASIKSPHILLISVFLPTPPPEATFVGGLPVGAIEAIKATYGTVVQILDPPKDCYNLTMKLNFNKLPPKEETKLAILAKIASVREVGLGAPLRIVLKHLASRSVAPDMDQLVALVHRPNESFFLLPQRDKVTVIYPMRFKNSNDTILASSFLQEFLEARRSAALSNAPLCQWYPSPPQELQGLSEEALFANAGFVSFVIYPRHVNGNKLDKTVWNLSTFHAYVNYHVKCSEGFMHTRMRRRVESLIGALDHAKSDIDEPNKVETNTSFKPLIPNDSRSNSNSKGQYDFLLETYDEGTILRFSSPSTVHRLYRVKP